MNNQHDPNDGDPSINELLQDARTDLIGCISEFCKRYKIKKDSQEIFEGLISAGMSNRVLFFEHGRKIDEEPSHDTVNNVGELLRFIYYYFVSPDEKNITTSQIKKEAKFFVSRRKNRRGRAPLLSKEIIFYLIHYIETLTGEKFSYGTDAYDSQRHQGPKLDLLVKTYQYLEYLSILLLEPSHARRPHIIKPEGIHSLLFRSHKRH